MPQITINLKAKTLKAVQNHANETNQLLEKVANKAIEYYLDPGYEKDMDELYNEAVKIKASYNQVTASLLQRKLKVGYARALRLLENLNP